LLNSTDVFVIGGGPAGLAAAIAARQQGFRVVVADGAKPPIDKACGEALMPDAIAALEKLGVAVRCGCVSGAGCAFSVPACPQKRFSLPAMRALNSPDRLHRILTERAAELGADLLWQCAVTGISPGSCVWEIAAYGHRGLSEPTALTHACGRGPISSLAHVQVLDIPFAGIIASDPGLIAWKSIGENTARDI
jgi:flavin-dependent dehydrogenase